MFYCLLINILSINSLYIDPSIAPHSSIVVILFAVIFGLLSIVPPILAAVMYYMQKKDLILRPELL